MCLAYFYQMHIRNSTNRFCHQFRTLRIEIRRSTQQRYHRKFMRKCRRGHIATEARLTDILAPSHQMYIQTCSMITRRNYEANRWEDGSRVHSHIPYTGSNDQEPQFDAKSPQNFATALYKKVRIEPESRTNVLTIRKKSVSA